VGDHSPYAEATVEKETLMTATRSDFLILENGEKAKPPFAPEEYTARLEKLRAVMDKRDILCVLLT